jgi:hypothetical protein
MELIDKYGDLTAEAKIATEMGWEQELTEKKPGGKSPHRVK